MFKVKDVVSHCIKGQTCRSYDTPCFHAKKQIPHVSSEPMPFLLELSRGELGVSELSWGHPFNLASPSDDIFLAIFNFAPNVGQNEASVKQRP